MPFKRFPFSSLKVKAQLTVHASGSSLPPLRGLQLSSFAHWKHSSDFLSSRLRLRAEGVLGHQGCSHRGVPAPNYLCCSLWKVKSCRLCGVTEVWVGHCNRFALSVGGIGLWGGTWFGLTSFPHAVVVLVVLKIFPCADFLAATFQCSGLGSGEHKSCYFDRLPKLQVT